MISSHFKREQYAILNKYAYSSKPVCLGLSTYLSEMYTGQAHTEQYEIVSLDKYYWIYELHE